MHLLVIEDERALCETIVRSLRRLAYSVDYCYDGELSLIHISEPTRQAEISYAVFCLKKKKKEEKKQK